MYNVTSLKYHVVLMISLENFQSTILGQIHFITRVKGTNMDHGTNMGSGLFLVSKKRYLPETKRNIQREQRKHIVPIL